MAGNERRRLPPRNRRGPSVGSWGIWPGLQSVGLGLRDRGDPRPALLGSQLGPPTSTPRPDPARPLRRRSRGTANAVRGNRQSPGPPSRTSAWPRGTADGSGIRPADGRRRAPLLAATLSGRGESGPARGPPPGGPLYTDASGPRRYLSRSPSPRSVRGT